MTDPIDNPDVQQRIQLMRSRVFFGHAMGNMVNILIGGALIAVVLGSGGVSYRALSLWGGLLAATALAVLLFDRWIERKGVMADNYRLLVGTRSVLGVSVTLFYGVAGFLLPMSGATMVQDTFLFVILSALVTIGVLSYAVLPFHYLLLDLASLVPLTVMYLLRYQATGNDYYLILVALSVIWQAVILRKSMRVSQTVIGSIALNERLLEEAEEHKKTRDAIRHLAMHDYLTGLANRRQFEETAERALKIADRDAAPLGLLAIDLDDFKPVNDQYGHATGDRLLVAVASRLRETLRASDFAARMGGDEFAVIINNVDDVADVHEVLTKLRTVLCQPYPLDGIVVSVGASIGWAVFPDDGDSLEALQRVADARMYADKNQRKQQLDTPAIP